MCMEVIFINILALHLAPQTKTPGSAPGGTAWTYTTTRTNGEATPSSSQSKWLEKGGFFGELIKWGLDLGQQASSDIFNRPLSAKIFKSHTKVEAYALMATDLKNIVSQINDAASKLHSALRHNKEN